MTDIKLILVLALIALAPLAWAESHNRETDFEEPYQLQAPVAAPVAQPASQVFATPHARGMASQPSAQTAKPAVKVSLPAIPKRTIEEPYRAPAGVTDILEPRTAGTTVGRGMRASDVRSSRNGTLGSGRGLTKEELTAHLETAGVRDPMSLVRLYSPVQLEQMYGNQTLPAELSESGGWNRVIEMLTIVDPGPGRSHQPATPPAQPASQPAAPASATNTPTVPAPPAPPATVTGADAIKPAASRTTTSLPASPETQAKNKETLTRAGRGEGKLAQQDIDNFNKTQEQIRTGKPAEKQQAVQEQKQMFANWAGAMTDKQRQESIDYYKDMKARGKWGELTPLGQAYGSYVLDLENQPTYLAKKASWEAKDKLVSGVVGEPGIDGKYNLDALNGNPKFNEAAAWYRKKYNDPLQMMSYLRNQAGGEKDNKTKMYREVLLASSVEDNSGNHVFSIKGKDGTIKTYRLTGAQGEQDAIGKAIQEAGPDAEFHYGAADGKYGPVQKLKDGGTEFEPEPTPSPDPEAKKDSTKPADKKS